MYQHGTATLAGLVLTTASALLQDIELSRVNAKQLALAAPRLLFLTLASSFDARDKRVNASGSVAALAGLSSLRKLSLINCQSDTGLDALTQLTSLHITFPNHVPDLGSLPRSVIEAHRCVCGGSLANGPGCCVLLLPATLEALAGLAVEFMSSH